MSLACPSGLVALDLEDVEGVEAAERQAGSGVRRTSVMARSLEDVDAF